MCRLEFFNIRGASLKLSRLLMSTVPSLNLIEPSMKRMNFLMQMNLQRLTMVCTCNYMYTSIQKIILLLILPFTDVVFFRKWLGRYRLEHIQAKACPTDKDLGLLLIDTNQLKAQLLPSPVKCLEVHVLRKYTE